MAIISLFVLKVLFVDDTTGNIDNEFKFECFPSDYTVKQLADDFKFISYLMIKISNEKPLNSLKTKQIGLIRKKGQNMFIFGQDLVK